MNIMDALQPNESLLFIIIGLALLYSEFVH